MGRIEEASWSSWSWRYRSASRQCTSATRIGGLMSVLKTVRTWACVFTTVCTASMVPATNVQPRMHEHGVMEGVEKVGARCGVGLGTRRQVVDVDHDASGV